MKRVRDLQLPADSDSRWVLDFAMAGNRTCPAGRRVVVDAVLGSLTEKLAAVVLQVPDQVNPFHKFTL